ncbi:hypothetical protein EON65_12405 [archaeon]|nr:MAG: hypothetical protein EON65_12405 [archaeon]
MSSLADHSADAQDRYQIPADQIRVELALCRAEIASADAQEMGSGSSVVGQCKNDRLYILSGGCDLWTQLTDSFEKPSSNCVQPVVRVEGGVPVQRVDAGLVRLSLHGHDDGVAERQHEPVGRGLGQAVQSGRQVDVTAGGGPQRARRQLWGYEFGHLLCC